MNKLIATLVAAAFSVGTAFAQVPGQPPHPDEPHHVMPKPKPMPKHKKIHKRIIKKAPMDHPSQR